MLCVVCGKEVPFALADAGGMNPWCSDQCGARWRARNSFLFQGGGATLQERGLATVMKHCFAADEPTLATLGQVRTALRPLAKEMELGAAFNRSAQHVGAPYTDTEWYDKVDKKEIGKKKVTFDKVLKSGKVIQRTVEEPVYKTTTTRAHRSVTVTPTIDITPDKMLQIALMAYNAALHLASSQLPVILYRVTDKANLTKAEKQQTLSASVHATVGNAEVWPLQKTAAWIQGALRARATFVLLSDPREPGILVGGIDRASDAVYVRELHQITSMRYTIEKGAGKQVPACLGKKRLVPFILVPPSRELGVLPLLPKMSAQMDWSHTWNGEETSLALDDDAGLIRNHLVKLFTERGKEIDLPLY